MAFIIITQACVSRPMGSSCASGSRAIKKRRSTQNYPDAAREYESAVRSRREFRATIVSYYASQ